MPVDGRTETIWVQIMPSLLGAGFLLLTLFFNNQTVGVLKQNVSPTAQMDRFQAQRAAQIAAAEYGSELLRAAAVAVDETRIRIPRDAAICLTARRLADEAISNAMVPGKDFAAELDRWNAEATAMETFCAYAMRVGEAK